MSKCELAVIVLATAAMTFVCSKAAYLIAEGMAAVLVVMQP